MKLHFAIIVRLFGFLVLKSQHQHWPKENLIPDKKNIQNVDVEYSLKFKTIYIFLVREIICNHFFTMPIDIWFLNKIGQLSAVKVFISPQSGVFSPNHTPSKIFAKK